MKQETVEKALGMKDSVIIAHLMVDPNRVEDELTMAKYYIGERSWILAGLGAIESGHSEQAAAIAISDFFSTIEALEPPEEEGNPYLLTGEELERATDKRKRGEHGQGLLEFSAIAFFLGIALLACYLVLMPVMTKAIQSVPAPVSAVAIVQPLDDNTIAQIAASDAAMCSAIPSDHAQIAHGSAAWQAINACNDPGAQKMVHINPMTGRKMTGCMLAGKIYVVVDDKDGKNITAYPKEELHFWDELTRYFRFSGYTR